MKILSLKAYNFMKYSTLELENFPEKGILGIFGENESGKSSIGEAICFSIFGSTTKFDFKFIDSVIKWGEKYCSTEIQILIENCNENKHVTIKREITKNNKYSSILILNEKIIEDTWQSANKKIIELLGFNLQDFRFTSFMVQKEIDLLYRSPEKSNDVINSMLKTGIIEQSILYVENNIIKLKNEMSEKESFKKNLTNELNKIENLLQNSNEINQKINKINTTIKDLENEFTSTQSSISKEESFLKFNKKLHALNYQSLDIDDKIRFSSEKIAHLHQDLSNIAENTFGIKSENPDCLNQQCKEIILKDITSLGASKEHLRKIEQAQTQTIEKEALMNLLKVKEESLEILNNQLLRKNELSKKIKDLEKELNEIQLKKRTDSKNKQKKIKINIDLCNDLEKIKYEITDKIKHLRNELKNKIKENISKKTSLLNQINFSEKNIYKNESISNCNNNKIDYFLYEQNEQKEILFDEINKEIQLFNLKISNYTSFFLFSILFTLISGIIIFTFFQNNPNVILYFSFIPISALGMSIFFIKKKNNTEILKTYKLNIKTNMEKELKNNIITIEKEINKIQEFINKITLLYDFIIKMNFQNFHQISESIFKKDKLNIEILTKKIYSENKSFIYDIFLKDSKNITFFENMTEIINNFSIKLETFSEMWKNDLLSNKFDPNLSWEKIIQYIKQTELDNLERENELIAHLNSLNTEIETKSYIDIKSEDLEEDISDISEKIIRIDKNLEPFSKRNINEEEIITLENIQHLETHLEKEKEGLHLIEFTLNRVNEEKSKIQTLKNQTEEIELQKENVIKEIAQLYSETENMKTNTYEKFSFENFEEFKIAEEKKISNMKSILNSISYKKTALLTEIAHLKGELKGFETLTERYNSLSDKIYILKTKIQKIDLDLKACPEIKKGLIETTKHIKAGFIPEFSHYVGRILSHITLDRYHKIKVDNDLTIKIYSPEKNDFIYPFQLSGGTSDQLMLAIRLAFANTLLQNRGQKFLFLDEHLASFDNNRKETFLDILKYLEFSFDQIILISHLSGMEKYMDSHIFLDKTETTVIRKTLNQ